MQCLKKKYGRSVIFEKKPLKRRIASLIVPGLKEAQRREKLPHNVAALAMLYGEEPPDRAGVHFGRPRGYGASSGCRRDLNNRPVGFSGSLFPATVTMEEGV
ncbi:hypothetical protein TNCV_2929841 [Trichonephila clavipes]|nr:hypothetical protein TNCV_2929841 [Trichonephila clavipes]